MFKNLTFYLFDESWTAPEGQALQDLQELLSLRQFTPIQPTSEKSVGWAPPRKTEGEAFLEVSGHNWLLRLVVERKNVPSGAVSAEVQRLQREREEAEGAKLSRKEVRALKDEAYMNLLPKAFAKKAEVLVWLDMANRRVIFDSTSTSLVDEAITQLSQLLHDAGAPLALMAWSPLTPLEDAMGLWLSEQNFPEGFEPDEYLEMRSGGEDLASVRYSRHNLEIDEVVEHIRQGKRVLELGLAWQERTSFHLCANGSLKKVALLIDVFEDTDESFDADVVLYTEELSQLLNALTAVLGHGPTGGGDTDIRTSGSKATAASEAVSD